MAPLLQICLQQDSHSKRALCCQTEAPQVRQKTDCSLHQHFEHNHLSRNHANLKQRGASDIQSSVCAASAARSRPQETSLTSSEKRSRPLHSAPVNLAKENSGRFFTSPHVTVMVLLSAGGKLQVSHCVKGNESQDGGFPCVTGACSGYSMFV